MGSNLLMMPYKQVLLQVIKPFNSVFNSLLVGSLKSAHGDFSHALILDKIRNGEFIFKNTNSENKKFTIPIDDPYSPDEFFFVHMELTDEKIAEASNAQQQVAVGQQVSKFPLHSNSKSELKRKKSTESTVSSQKQSRTEH